MSLRDFVRFRAVYCKHEADVAIMNVKSQETVNVNDEDDDDDTDGFDDHDCNGIHAGISSPKVGTAPVSGIRLGLEQPIPPKKRKVFRVSDLEPLTNAVIPNPQDNDVPPTPDVQEILPVLAAPVPAGGPVRGRQPKRSIRSRK